MVFLQETGCRRSTSPWIGGGKEDAGILLHQRIESVDQCWYRSMEALGWASGEVDFGEVAAVHVEDVYRTKLVEIAAGEAAEAVFKVPRGEVDVFGTDDRIADAGAIVALFDLVPPALALIFDHGWLFEEDAGGGAEEVEEGLRGSGYERGEMGTPSRERRWLRRCEC